MKAKQVALATVLFAAPSLAWAQNAQIEFDPDDDSIISLEVGGGVFDFVDPDMDEVTNLGGTWTVRGTVLPSMPVSVELAYVGAMNEIESATIPQDLDAQLLLNGGEALARLNVAELFLQQPKSLRFEPYVAGGAAYTNLTVIGDDRNDPLVDGVLRDSTDLFAIPVAAGVQAEIRNATVGVRVGTNYLFENDLRRGTSDDAQSWSASANAGFTF